MPLKWAQSGWFVLLKAVMGLLLFMTTDGFNSTTVE
jgi:hypothetical protein|tara:strand:- start:644 stop:751 length:108 start_codon:yes stop_codon:yes gene_type:complete